MRRLPLRLLHSTPRAAALDRGMNAATFKALFETPGDRSQRFKYRWDWHLRNFLTAMIPPAALFTVIQIVKWHHDRRGFTLDSVLEGEAVTQLAGGAAEKLQVMQQREEEPAGWIDGMQHQVELRLQKVERELQRLREREEKLEKLNRINTAKDIARGVGRGNKFCEEDGEG